MRMNKRVGDKLIDAARHGRCLHASSHADQAVLSRLVRTGLVVRARQGLYASREVWRELTPRQRYVWVIRGLHVWHPDWVFAGLSVIALHGIEYPLWLDERQTVFLASVRAVGVARKSTTRYIHVEQYRELCGQGRCMTSVARALLDCAASFEFREVLPMVDSALRKRLVTRQELANVPGLSSPLKAKVGFLLRYADPGSENGGESLCRATIIEEGFPPPKLQQEFRMRDGRKYRVDGLYRLADGSMVVVEYDGMGKYVDDAMTGGRSVRQVVHAEKRREQDLLDSGVTRIVRFDYRDVLRRDPVVRKLLEAGVPRIARIQWPFSVQR
ncbi:hypothetical protein PT282_03600 [Bifidobacterium sp. ESL0763]|uniref:hypothetical protein n=1 Tax=Bifidobacterium sp. ESL0763 TaxID=2983227 RepID=UPI0023F6773B|nr:hypothetical protein [Bifidobacterium sp. ESL0763]MDF7663752.1 hypothetical protein [Bifidobacterium sp. ESL0763]